MEVNGPATVEAHIMLHGPLNLLCREIYMIAVDLALKTAYSLKDLKFVQSLNIS